MSRLILSLSVAAALTMGTRAAPADAPKGEVVLTADDVAARAVTTSFTVRAAESTLGAAAADLDRAWLAFLPRLGASVAYARLSDFVPVKQDIAGVNVVVTDAPDGTVNPATVTAKQVDLSFPNVLDRFSLDVTASLPVSDWIFRLPHLRAAAASTADAARRGVETARLAAALEGRVAFYVWLKGRGAIEIARAALDDRRTHQHDVKALAGAGRATRTDVLRAEAALAAAELTLERSLNFAALCEKQLRLATRLGPDVPLTPGESLDDALPALDASPARLTALAFAGRRDLAQLADRASALHDLQVASSASALPTLSAVAEATYANPNLRVFPANQSWFPTWSVGATLTWSPNDAMASGATARSFARQADAVDATRSALALAIELEVAQAVVAVHEADVATSLTRRQVDAATEAHRAARALFTEGVVTSTTLNDAQVELVQARLDALNVRAGARLARTRLSAALGRREGTTENF